jgi:ribosomal-protein-alanine N-acetyltransferase
MKFEAYLSLLTVDDIPEMESIEKQTRLSFWGREHYQKFLREFPEYFGCKAMISQLPELNELAGFLLARSVFENLEILKVGVLPAYQRLGIGTRLMEAAYTEGIRRGCRRCFLEVRASNQVAIGFYNAHKFRVTGRRTDYYSNPAEDALIMERPF